MSSPKTNEPRDPRPPMGKPRAVRFAVEIMAGNKSHTPNRTMEPGKDGWEVIEDELRGCLWVGYRGEWSRVPWEQVSFMSYWPRPAAEDEGKAVA